VSGLLSSKAPVEAITVIIECTNCRARYQYDDERFEGKASKKIKCAKCATVFEIHKPSATGSKPATPSPSPGDLTFSKSTPVQPKPPPPPPPPPRMSEPAEEKRPTGKLGGSPQMPAGKRLSLAVINGPDAGNVYRIEKPRVTIGRTGADLALNDTEVSRIHAAIEIRDLTYVLEDMKSTNGTLVEEQKISGQVELMNQGEFQIGGTIIMLIVTEEG
jgi:predicted Zn finger-like uncharacterized protein